MSKKAIVTGGAGFIGSHLVDRLIAEDWEVTIIDNFDPFYDESIKRSNISGFINHPNVRLLEIDLRDCEALEKNLTDHYDAIVHLAAKAGVRPSIQDPVLYQQVNVLGTQNLLELSKKLSIKQFVFASSSSVYGVNPKVPWSESDYVLQPISPYASSKISGELLGHVYTKLYDIRFIALRFFTVTGPRQRPDLAIHKFARKILQGEPIPVFGDGTTRRDYTYVQ
ncbi:MAG TPA: NAD-dependent epimerase/dehydratase family protein, partial [Phaeodactylibacter sp.]|nr:NAD-dependent epimerase/dehydratase family protein [Phaeodactylibacter sp.]